MLTLQTALSLHLAYVAPASTPLAVNVRSQHRAQWGISLAQQHRVQWQNAAKTRSAHRAPWQSNTLIRSAHSAPWQSNTLIRSAHSAPWHLLTSAQLLHSSGYSITAVHSAAARHRAVWHLQDAAIHNITNTPAVQHSGRTLPILSATLSADELSPHWLAAVTLQNQADFAAMQLGDAITLTLGLASYALRIDAMSSARPDPQDTTYSITAVSPLAWLDAPWCGPADFSRSTAVLASAAVQDLVGPVQWNLPDWTIPAGALAIANATPLAAARTIAAAVGAVIESQPNGSTLVRARHPVSPPDYSLSACSHTLSDVVLLASTARGAPLRGFNRLQVANTATSADPTSSTDTLEWVPDDTTASAPTAGTVRARLGFQRPVLLVHSGHPSTVIASQGSVTRTETELLEFVAGTTSPQYPADSITTHTWQHADLGALQISPSDASSITAATPGYSLGRISYQTTALQWRVQLASPAETVQFILIDA